MRLIVTGYAQHGKDTVCEILRDVYGFKFESSSYFVAEKAVRPWLAARGIVYSTFEELYADRVNHRPEWKQAIAEYNTPNPSRLGRELFEAGNDIYCGLRERRELDALRKIMAPKDYNTETPAIEPLIKLVVWIDSSSRKPPEPESSITIKMTDCDYVLSNNGTFEELFANVTALYLYLKGLA